MLNSIAVGSRWAVLTRRACPVCGSMKTSRSHRQSMLDDALGAVRVNPYLCGHCATRFYALPFLRSLGDKPWSADRRDCTIGQRCSFEPSVFPVALLSALMILLLSGMAAVFLVLINGLAALAMMY